MPPDVNRRRLLGASGALLLCSAAPLSLGEESHEKKDEPETPAAEDLMREHGVLRRALLIYSEAAARVEAGRPDLPLPALAATAELFRRFGEDYHERRLEEEHLFPSLRNGPHGGLVQTLTRQHERGREMTAYIGAVARKGRIVAAHANPFAQAVRQFVRMYQHHAAIEDTVVFPAWKRAIGKAQYHELTEQFEKLEHQMFGTDGFEDALRRIAGAEQAFGLSDLDALTAPAPPQVT